MITLPCLRLGNFVRHIALRSELYFVYNGVFMVCLFIRILYSSSVIFYETL